jgi:fibronectin type 3 domain-containing protein
MTTAAFEWTPISDARVQGVVVYRNNPSSKQPTKLLEVAMVNNPRATHYLDEKLTPETMYHYRFATYTAKGHVSIASDELDVRTKPLLPSVSFFSTTESLPRSAKLVWRPHTDNSIVAYRLERRESGADEWRKIAKIRGRHNAEYIDEDLKDNTRYEYRLKSITFNDIISKPSETTAVVTKAPPPPVDSINASQGKAGVIEVSWTDDNRANIRYYRVYRASSETGRYRLIADNVNAMHYNDTISKTSQQYFYKVVGVKADGLDGDLKAVKAAAGITIDAPDGPNNLVAMVQNSTVQLTWTSTDPRTVSFIVTKEISKGFLSSETKVFKNIKKTLMIDSSLKHGEEYTFSVVSVDKNGIKSAPSISDRLNRLLCLLKKRMLPFILWPAMLPTPMNILSRPV